MKTPTTYTPYFLSLSLAIVFVAMFALAGSQNKQIYAITASGNHSKINRPGPAVKSIPAKKIIEGTPVFLKEDVREEVPESSAIRKVNNSNSISETQWIEERITTESTTEDTDTPYFVLAGSYTDNMRLLSKHAQYKNKGYDAEIISFENQKTKHICMGRFADKNAADDYATKVGKELDIRTYVYGS